VCLSFDVANASRIVSWFICLYNYQCLAHIKHSLMFAGWSKIKLKNVVIVYVCVHTTHVCLGNTGLA
jgi:hypothetical protein